MVRLEDIATEQRNMRSNHLDEMTALEIATLINEEDHKIAPAIRLILPRIAKAIDWITKQLANGGRLFYLGAGTSGRLGILDAAECPPTYSTPPELVQGIIAGGTPAIFLAQEGAEDSPQLAEDDLKSHALTSRDVLVGIAASGRTPYVLGGLQYAASIDVPTIAVTCNPDSPISKLAAIDLTVFVGPEVVTGSTRMKAGTATKMILNMLSTGAMIRLGKVYRNLMVDVKASNEKLQERSRRIVMEATECSRREAIDALEKANGSAKLAIFQLLSHLPLDDARNYLVKAHGRIGDALQHLPRAT